MRLLATQLLLLLAPQAPLLSTSIACTNIARFGRSSSALTASSMATVFSGA